MVNLKVWIDDTVVYHSKNGQKATLSFMNKLGDMLCAVTNTEQLIGLKRECIMMTI